MDIGFRSLRDIGYWIPKASRYWILDSESLQILDIDNTITRRSTQYQNGIVLIRTVLRLGCGFGESKLWRSRSIVASVLWDFCLMCLATKFLAQPLLPEVLWLRKASLTVPGNLPGKASTWHGQTHSRSSQKEFPGNTSGFPPTELWAAELRCSFPMPNSAVSLPQGFQRVVGMSSDSSRSR